MRTLARLVGTLLGVLLLVVLVFGAVFYTHPLWVADQGTRFRLWQRGVESKYVPVGGYRIHYFEAPAGSGGGARVHGTPLVLVHGLGARSEDWAALLPRLAADGYHVYALDLLGYGRSPQPDVDYSITLEENLVVQFMQTLNIPRADVAGWSMGGWVAAKLTVDHPELVDRLVLYDSAGVYFPATFDADLFTPTDEPGLFHLQEMLDPHPRKLPGFAARAALKKLAANKWVIERSVASMVAGRDLLDFRLAGIARPTLLVWGSKDVLIPLSVADTMHRLIPHSTLDLIDGCGHLAPAQCPNSALKAAVDFLDAPQPPQGGEATLPGN
jgi:pimeloyl-ACP methyl ester carboxylesterase